MHKFGSETLHGSFINKNGQEVPYSEISRTFAETKYGKKLAGRVRYDRFKPKHWTNQQWEKLLGSDVNNARHMPLTYGVGRHLLREQRNHLGNGPKLGREKEEIVLISAHTHDWAEAVSKHGDLPSDFKTDETEKLEKSILRWMLDELLGHHLTQVYRTQILETVFNQEHELGRVFNLVERLGYMRTALLAWEKFGSPKVQGLTHPDAPNLQWITAEVLSNHMSKMVVTAPQFPAIAKFLDAKEDSLAEIYETLPDTVFDLYPAEKAPEKRANFQTGKKYWNAWTLRELA